MSLRLLHTADWHLGQSFHGLSRDTEHMHFLSWLVDRIEEHAVDALVVAGDVFDVQNPPISAQAAFYRFLARAKRQRPGLDVVVVAGNHDSGGRLEAPSALLDELGVRVVGGVGWRADGSADIDRLLVPLTGADGEVAAWCAALPYLRPADLPAPESPEADPFIEGTRRVYATVLEAARARLGHHQSLIATGHCHMTGGLVSELSERRILGGNLHALPADIFPDDLAYVALGHLHRAQKVDGRDAVRYAGSPLPLALDEDRYSHQVVLAEVAEGRMVDVEPLRVPRLVDIHRLPVGGAAGDLDAALNAIRTLPPAASADRDTWPYLEVSVRLDQPRPDLRDVVETALAGKAARLVKLTAVHTGRGDALAETAAGLDLKTLAPEDVFRRAYARDHDGDPDDALLAAFHELVRLAEETAA